MPSTSSAALEADFFFCISFAGDVIEVMLREIDFTGAVVVVAAAAFVVAAFVLRVLGADVIDVAPDRSSQMFFGLGASNSSRILSKFFFRACCFHFVMTVCVAFRLGLVTRPKTAGFQLQISSTTPDSLEHFAIPPFLSTHLSKSCFLSLVRPRSEVDLVAAGGFNSSKLTSSRSSRLSTKSSSDCVMIAKEK